MFKRSFFLILSVLTVLFMSTVRYDGNHTINQQLSEAGVINVPAFLLPTSESDSKLISSFLKPNVSPAEVLKTMKVPALRGQMDDALTQELKRKLNANPIWRKLLANKRLSVGIVDMSNKGNVKFAALNGRHMMYAASLPKIAVLAAAHDAIERGELKETAEIQRDMLLMIAKSNNAATTRMIDRLGFAHIERTMTDPNLKLYDPAFGGGLWVGKRYAGGGKRSPDPMKGISHAATTEQICRYFYLLANNELVSEESSEKMRSYLVDPQLHHKFVNTLDRIAPDAKVYRKSGSWSSFHADVAMVQGPGRNYIMTALIDDPAGESICRELAAVLDGILKE